MLKLESFLWFIALTSCTGVKTTDAVPPGETPDTGGNTDTHDTGCDAPATWYLDGDGDGYGVTEGAVTACDAPDGAVATSDDCDDTRAEVHPGAEERCDDGTDNDCSGLSDCEEESCASEASCVETDCDNGFDSDDDGLTDCDDDDCWGDPVCPTLMARVSGGHLDAERVRWQTTTSGHGAGGCSSDRLSTGATAVATSVSGTVRALTEDGHDWVSCAWSVDRATLRASRLETFGAEGVPGTSCVVTSTHSFESTTAVVERSGFTVEAGCGVVDSGFLPDLIRPPRGGDLAARWSYNNMPWYDGAIVTSTSFYHDNALYSNTSAGVYGSWQTFSAASWTIPAMSGSWAGVP